MYLSKLLICFIVVIGSVSFSYAGQKEYCEGWEEGYKAIKGNNAYVPYCPYAPYTPYGSTDYREGLKAGMKKAKGE